MFNDMFVSYEKKEEPTETFYDGYVVTASSMPSTIWQDRKWEPIEIEGWRGGKHEKVKTTKDYDDEHILIKDEIMPDGAHKFILQHKQTEGSHRSSNKTISHDNGEPKRLSIQLRINN